MNATIDTDTCTGCEECVILCPDVFELNMTTYLAEVKTPEVPESFQGDVDNAASSCPMDAIRLTA